ncbi:MAG: Epimerase family protein [Syntrophus sp. PtaU1.Bin208]|nr:MAG: Epimerase family protein [Syntrophus sp. PtaU1.Bin208]
MKILMSGASGLIGSALAPYLEARGQKILRLVRNKSKTGVFWDPRQGILDLPADAEIDAAINLSGDNIGNGRWTKQKKERIRCSRIDSTFLFAERIARLNRPPKVFLSASGIGFYGDGGNIVLNETSPAGKGFLAGISREWEAAAKTAKKVGIRVANLRISPVLSRYGGLLPRLLPLSKAGLGAVLGSGKQYMSWIAVDDLVAAMDFILRTDSFSGPVNLCAPNPVTNREFTKALNAILKRPTLFRIPSFLLRAFLGEMADEEFLVSTRAVPDKLTSSGFEFKHPAIEEALRHVLSR